MGDFFHEENYKKVLEFLDSKNLLKQNQEMVGKLDNAELGCCSQFLRVAEYLSKCNLLDQESLSRCIEITQTKPIPKYSWEEPTELYDSGIFDLLQKLDDYKIKIEKKELEILLHLKKSNIERVSKVIDGLGKDQLPDANSFSKAVQRITEKLPPVSESTTVRESRKDTGSLKSEIKLSNENISIFPEPGKKSNVALSEVMGSAPVKKGFSKPDDENPTFIIKTIGRAHYSPPKEDVREVKYNKMLHSAFISVHPLRGRN